MPTYDYQCDTCGTMEIFHSMTEDAKDFCPECGKPGLRRLLSGGSGIIIGGREANQYSDIHKAKYWRDKNGVRHRVSTADGYSTSATVSKQEATPAEIEARKKADRKQSKQERLSLTTARATAKNRAEAKRSTSWGDGYIKEEL